MSRFILILISLIISAYCRTNSETIAGIVVDENGEYLPFSTIRIMHKPIAVLSDAKGLFILKSKNINPTDTISISYIGYENMYLPVSKLSADSIESIRLHASMNMLHEITVLPEKKGTRKTVSKGKKHSWSLLRTCICGKTAGDTYGYEFHSKNNKKLLLEKVGFFYCAGDRQMTGMNFRINVYDMSNVAGDPSSDFINVLDAPKFFEYKLDDNDNGKFEFILPEPIILPEHAMVEIEFLENLDDEIFWFKSNLIGGKTWTKLFNENIWVKTPFSTPFFIECSEIED